MNHCPRPPAIINHPSQQLVVRSPAALPLFLLALLMPLAYRRVNATTITLTNATQLLLNDNNISSISILLGKNKGE